MIAVRFIHGLQGFRYAPSARVYSSVRIKGLYGVSIGEDSFVGDGTTFVGGLDSRVFIGRNCDISDHVHFVCGSHEVGAKERRAGRGLSQDIVVGDGVWIGYRSTILPGVTIGDGAIIGAGSLVNKDISCNSIYAGVPARRIKRLK